MFVPYRKEAGAVLLRAPLGRRPRGSRRQTLSGFLEELWVYHLLGEFVVEFGKEEDRY